MALPTSRDNTLNPGSSKVPAALLNNLQDCVVGGKHGLITKRFGPTQILSIDPSTVVVTYTPGYALNDSGNPGFLCSLSLPIGAVIVAIRVRVLPSGSLNVLRAQLRRYVFATDADSGEWFDDSVAAGGQQEITLTGVTPFTQTVAENFAVYITRTAGSASLNRVYYVDVDYRMP